MADEAERMQMRPHDEADTCAGPPSQQHMPYETPRHPGTVAHSSRPAVTNPIRMPPAPLLPPLPLPPFSLSFLFFSHSSSFSSFSPLSLPLLPSSSSSLSTFTFLFFSSSLPSSPLFPRTSAPDCPADAALGDSVSQRPSLPVLQRVLDRRQALRSQTLPPLVYDKVFRPHANTSSHLDTPLKQ